MSARNDWEAEKLRKSGVDRKNPAVAKIAKSNEGNKKGQWRDAKMSETRFENGRLYQKPC